MDILPTLLDILLVAFLIFMNGFFVAAEFCCVKIRTSRLETLIAEGSSRAGYAKQLTEHLDYSLSVTQFGITLASLGLGWVGEPAIATLILPVTHVFGLPDEVGHTIALAIAFTIITSLHIVLGELLCISGAAAPLRNQRFKARGTDLHAAEFCRNKEPVHEDQKGNKQYVEQCGQYVHV